MLLQQWVRSDMTSWHHSLLLCTHRTQQKGWSIIISKSRCTYQGKLSFSTISSIMMTHHIPHYQLSWIEVTNIEKMTVVHRASKNQNLCFSKILRYGYEIWSWIKLKSFFNIGNQIYKRSVTNDDTKKIYSSVIQKRPLSYYVGQHSIFTRQQKNADDLGLSSTPWLWMDLWKIR